VLRCQGLRLLDTAEKVHKLVRQASLWKRHMRSRFTHQMHSQHELWPAQIAIFICVGELPDLVQRPLIQSRSREEILRLHSRYETILVSIELEK
jgi:hypothetical protein